MLTARAPLLVFAYGNPSRGDDALGPAIYDRLEALQQENELLGDVELLTDYQLQIEHAVDLEQREAVLFIDASVSCSAPYEFQRLLGQQDDSYTTHAMSPAAVLAVYQKINRVAPPAAYLLAVRGYDFALGKKISAAAEKNLQQAIEFVRKLLGSPIEDWQKKFF